ncbi:hypothetical protein N9L92_00510 [Saprospiraceae bacterium]|nr:hypothetical protein [Saprospiraceae bacterium]
MKYTFVIISVLIIVFGCKSESLKTVDSGVQLSSMSTQSESEYDNKTKTIHILVALCDNRYQGIVPVPQSIGNGQDPKNNLYWGTAYGIKTYFNRSQKWKLISS